HGVRVLRREPGEEEATAAERDVWPPYRVGVLCVVLFSISDSIDHGFTVFFGWLPHVLGFIAVLLIGWIVARIVGKLVAGVTHRAGLGRAVHTGTGGSFLQRVVPRPSHLVGRIVFWVLCLSAVSLAAAVLGVASLTAFV